MTAVVREPAAHSDLDGDGVTVVQGASPGPRTSTGSSPARMPSSTPSLRSRARTRSTSWTRSSSLKRWRGQLHRSVGTEPDAAEDLAFLEWAHDALAAAMPPDLRAGPGPQRLPARQLRGRGHRRGVCRPGLGDLHPGEAARRPRDPARRLERAGRRGPARPGRARHRADRRRGVPAPGRGDRGVLRGVGTDSDRPGSAPSRRRSHTCRVCAADQAIRNPSGSAASSAPPASSSVRGAASAITAPTPRPVWKDLPKSPCRAPSSPSA
nr:hypothetical protein [Actinomadura sp. WMMA1423]